MLSATMVCSDTEGITMFSRVTLKVRSLSATGRCTFNSIVVPGSPRSLPLT